MKKFFTILFVLLLTLACLQPAQTMPGENFPDGLFNESSPGSSSDNAYLERVSSFPYGPAISISVDSSRHLIFVSSGGAALILDGSDPTNLQLLTDTLRTDGLVYDVAYDDVAQRLYFACGYGGFEIWDVQNPYQPFRYCNFTVTYFDVPVPVEHVQIRGNIAVVECSWGFVHSINVTDPYNPFEQGFVGTMGNPSNEIYVEPTEFVHTTGQNGYYRYYMDADGNFFDAGSRYFLYGAYDVFGTHDLAFVGYGDLYILDLHTSAFLPWSVTDVGGIGHIVVRNNFAYITNSNGLNIWDVSDPSNPFWVSTTPIRYLSNDFVIAGSYLYAAERDFGFDIVDISDPANPFIAGSYESFSSTRNVCVNGNYAYLSHLDDGVLITDISDIEYPVLVGQFDTPGATYHLTVKNDVLYVADWTGGLRIADISDPQNPVELSSVQNFNAWLVEVSGNYAYVIEGVPNVPDNLRIFNVSDPSNPIQVSIMSTPGETDAMKFKDNYLFLASSEAGFRVVDVSDPYNPVTVSGLDFPTYVTDVNVRDNYAYVTSLGIGAPFSGLHIVDISDPENPFEAGEYTDVALAPFDVEVSGDFAYLTDDHDLAAFLISDPLNPVYLESIRTPDLFFGEFAIDSLIFVADMNAGLQIYRNVQFSQPGGGLYWRTQLETTTEGFYTIFFTDLNHGWAAGYSGELYRTTNGGEDWYEQPSGTGGDIYSICFANSQKGWFAGSSGQIFSTIDGGNTWQQQTSGTTNELYDISFVDDMNGWISGDEVILHTTNGGNSWIQQSAGYSGGFYSVDFVDLLHGWAVDLSDVGKMIKTTDGGASWTVRNGLSAYILFAVDFVNENTGYSVGMFGAIIKTTDGGNTWITLPDPPPHDWLYGIHFLDEEKGWITGFNGKVICTTDGGNTWQQQTSGTTAQLNSVFFIDQSHGWAAGEDTYQGGIIINYSPEIVPVELNSFKAVVEGNDVELYWQTATEHNNAGFSILRAAQRDNSKWNRIGFVEGKGTTAGGVSYSFVDKNLAVGKYYFKLKQIDFDGSFKELGMVEAEITAPGEFSLLQNFPNPFNPLTNLSYTLPLKSKVELKVFDVLGREISTLANEEQQAGIYNVEFNASKLPSGVYFYRLKAGKFVGIKKMVLLR